MALLSTSSPVWAQEISLESNTSLSREGYFVLSWTSGPDESTPLSSTSLSSTPLILQQSPADSFTSAKEFTIPPNGSITITGLEDGEYFFRAGIGNTVFSNVVSVEIAHHSLQRALTFFFIGLVLFLILLFTILKGQSGLKSGSQRGGDVKEDNNA